MLAGLCSWAGQFVSCLVGDSRRHIFVMTRLIYTGQNKLGIRIIGWHFCAYIQCFKCLLTWSFSTFIVLSFDTNLYLSHVTRKPVFGIFRPGKTQTGLLSHKSRLESWNFGFSNYRYYLQQDLEDRRMANHMDSVTSYYTPKERQLSAVPELQNHQPYQPS